MNCLVYALRFWEKHPEYKLWYNSDHVINIPTYVVNPFPNKEFLPVEDFGFQYFIKWDHALIEQSDIDLLIKYFRVCN